MTMLPFSQLRKAERKPLAEQLPLDGPLSVCIEPTAACNFHCGMCPQSIKGFDNKAQMSMKLHEKICKELRALGTVRVIRPCGIGEATLLPDLSERVDLAKTSWTRTELTTNGTSLKWLTDCNSLDYLRVSIYGTTREENKRVTGRFIDPERIRENVRAFREARKEHVKPWISVSAFCDYESVVIGYSGIVDEILDGRLTLHEWNDPGIGRVPDGAIHDVCPAPFYFMFFWANGDVTPCSIDWKREALVGNSKEQTVEEIWHGEPYKKLRRDHLERQRSKQKACANCTFCRTYGDNLDGIRQEQFEEVCR